MKADRYYCLGNLVKSNPRSTSELEESLKCVETFMRNPNACLYKGNAERDLLDIFSDQEDDCYVDARNLFGKAQQQFLQEARVYSGRKDVGVVFVPETPTNNFLGQWRTLDRTLKASPHKGELDEDGKPKEPHELDQAAFFKRYHRLVGGIIRYLMNEQERNYRDYSRFFIGGRNECTFWSNRPELDLIKMPSRETLKRPCFPKERGIAIVTPGSLKHGHFCRLTVPEMLIELFTEDDFRETREAKKPKGKSQELNKAMGPFPRQSRSKP